MRRRAGQPKPWTDDEILQSQYFTNVHREDDKVTIWFRENIREPLRDNPAVVFATIAFRWFNWPLTGAVLIGKGNFPEKPDLFVNWDLKDALARLTLLKEHGQVFTGAFNISNSGSTKPKINRVCEDYIQPMWESFSKKFRSDPNWVYKSDVFTSLEKCFKFIKSHPGLGGSGFMAAQVICDLAYTHVLENAPDWWSWCSWGPGSKRGMNRVSNFDVKYSMPKSEWRQRLLGLQMDIKARLGLGLHARDVQNCLCEFDKYERVLWNEGRSKRRYPGRA